MPDDPGLPCHPATALVLWLFFVLWMGIMTPLQLWVTAILVACLLWRRGLIQWRRYVWRSRWILLAASLASLWYQPSLAGGIQAIEATGRWLVMLAALAILMSHLSRDLMLTALLTVLMPLRVLGCSPQRWALRLGLTLHYAEAFLHESVPLTVRLQQLRQPVPERSVEIISIARLPFGWRDVYCVALAGVAGLGVKGLSSLSGLNGMH